MAANLAPAAADPAVVAALTAWQRTHPGEPFTVDTLTHSDLPGATLTAALTEGTMPGGRIA